MNTGLTFTGPFDFSVEKFINCALVNMWSSDQCLAYLHSILFCTWVCQYQ